MSPEFLRTILYLAIGVSALYATIGLLLYLFQEKLVFFPHEHLVATPQDGGMMYEEVTIQTSDGLQLSAWFVPAEEQRAVLLYFHGNGGNNSHRIETLRLFHSLGLSTLIVDYRGYGRSEGSPGEEGIYIDAEASWNYLVNDRNIHPGEIVLLGRSLGGAVATFLATRVSPRALIIESTFTSIPDRGAEIYPYFPVRLMSRIEFNSLDRIHSINCPLLVVHSPEDEIVPFGHGQKLFDAAPEPKEFLQISGGHNDGFFVSARRYESGLSSFLSKF